MGSIDAYPVANASTADAVLGYAEVIASQTGITAGNPGTDLTGLLVTVNVSAGRRLRITGKISGQFTSGTGQANLRIYEDGGTCIQEAPTRFDTVSTADTIIVSAMRTPSAGTHTYKLSFGTDSGGTVSMLTASTYPAFILVEDITGGTGGSGPIQLGYAEVTANQGSITTLVDLTGLTVTVAVPAGRRIRISGQAMSASTVADGQTNLVLREGSTVLGYGTIRPAATNTNETHYVTAVLSPSAAAHTYKLSMERSGSAVVTMIAGATYPAYIMVEDITGTPAPGASGAENIIYFSKSGTLTAGAGNGRFRFPFPVILLGVTAAVGTAPTGASLIADLNKNGTTVFTTQGNRPTIVASANATAAETVPDVTTLAVGDYLTVDVDQVGSTVAGSDLSVFVRYVRT